MQNSNKIIKISSRKNPYFHKQKMKRTTNKKVFRSSRKTEHFLNTFDNHIGMNAKLNIVIKNAA